MKKPIHLYILVPLSTIATILKIKGSFFTSFNEKDYRALLEGAEIEGIDQMVAQVKETTEFSANLINKGLTALLLIILVAVIFFLFKKENERASYAYVGYLFGTLIFSTYSYIASIQLSKAYETAALQEVANKTALIGYGINIALFAIYFGLTIFFLLKKPKVDPNMGQTATDI